jgi:hypothetical protein
MKTKALNRNLRRELLAILREEFEDTFAIDLFRRFLTADHREFGLVESLVEVASGRAGRPSWPLRRAATLMLESLLLAAPEDDPEPAERILRALAGARPGGLTYPPSRSILTEGYTTTNPLDFVRELRARIARHERVHRRLDGLRTSAEALGDFLHLARHEPSLTLGRYVFSPKEVVDRVFEQVRISLGMYAPPLCDFVESEAENLLDEWPAYEWAILRQLLAGSRIYWVDDTTGSQINGLLEYPLGTIVLVVKPPGSDFEIEIKRVGRRGEQPLKVIYERNGYRICSTHRLDAGSMGTNLRSEAESAATLAHFYRLIHGRTAPIPLTLSHRTIFSIPCQTGNADLIDYFTDESTFGCGFESMRRAMGLANTSFAKESGTTPIDAPGELGTTVEFLAQANPSQSVIAPTSSYRIDLVDSYLGQDGLDLYFRKGLGVEPSAAEARRFVETLLDAVLGTHQSLEGVGLDHAEFVDALFAQPDNRRKADEIYLDLAAQAGEFWGTLYGLKAHSSGESVVARNVGLRTIWKRGAWRVYLDFMDHDQLRIPREDFEPDRALWGIFHDAAHIALAPKSGRKSELYLLAKLYRVDDPGGTLGRTTFFEAAKKSSARTLEALRSSPEVRALYEADCLDKLLAWDVAIAGFARSRQAGDAIADATAEGVDLLRRLGRPEPEADSFTKITSEYDEFFCHFSAFFQASP